ncbi:Protein QA-X [Colletotrichum orbiculare MAFF 240422]|uniref:Inositol-1-monophosphatase n=1 Tax=Colletotrichum orbiculare (strain 104-T / ATCC 96160 / CBS 514.97 / LARS 414 / MAFF 240422) TaxID=1213857 RepID=N4VVU6_COLOR|nr:Protein QA-X [Colletotrichum orbiculare MAFF 240422]
MADISDNELREIYDFAVQLGKDAGAMLMKAARSRFDGSASQVFTEKESSVDLVTKTDTEVEAFIHNAITNKYPSHKFIGEETYSAGASRDYLVDDSPTWIIDPLDGTVNFTHLFPIFCVSIGFAIKGKPVIGVINAPFLNQTFSSCKGHGAWMNETQRLPLVLSPLPANAPSGCVESFVNMAAERGGRDGKGGMVHGMRSLGSATLDLAYVAMGSFDIWWEGGCWEWDVAAGIAIVEEAGGLVTIANPPEDTAVIPETKLGSRLYLAIRPAGPSDTETGRQAQERVVRETWKRVRQLDYSRPGA